MKSISILLSLFLSASLCAGSLDCSIYKNGHEQEMKLAQTSFAQDDPEEESETYELIYDGKVKAYVDYVPYQNGVDLYLEVVGESVSVHANFDQESDRHMDVELEYIETSYTLACSRI